MTAKIRAEKAGNRIFLATSLPTPGLKHFIPGANFRATDGVWSLPLDLPTCHLLRERFGARMTIGPLLTAWARAEKATQDRMEQLAASPDAELERLPEVAPALFAATSTRKYQRAGIRFIADSRGRDGRRRALLADTVGLGKTIQSIAATQEAGVAGPYLVTCPKTAVEITWAPQIRKWMGAATEVITLPEGKAGRLAVLDALAARTPASLSRTWIVVHPEAVRTQTWWICGECGDKTKFKAGMVQELDCGHRKVPRTKVEHDHVFPQLFALQYGAVIADESDQSLIRKTGTPNLRRRGMEMLRDLVRPEGIRLAMSGTPFRSKPHQIWSTLNWLDPIRWSSKWNFLGKYWQLGGYSGYTVGGFIEDRESMMIDELKDVMIRRTRDQVRGDLPAKLYPSNVTDDADLTPGIYLPMTPQQQRVYDQMEKSGSASLDGGEINAIGILAEMTRLKQFAGAVGTVIGGEFKPIAAGNKYEWIAEFLQELGFPDQPSTKVVIASQFTQMLNAFAEGVAKDLKLNAQTWMGMITGETRRREEVVARFEDPDDKLSILWINTKAGGSSITLDAADVMVVLDETWVDDEQQQLEGRIDNREPERRIVPRSYYYLRSAGSLEEGIARSNAAAKERGERILDGAAIARRRREILHR